jgi:hypothetical protein
VRPGFEPGSTATAENGHRVRALADAADSAPSPRLADVRIILVAHDKPAQDGVWLADRFHRACPVVPIVLLAAYRSGSLDRELAVRPFIRPVEKPVGYDELHTLIHTLAA